MKPVGYDIHVVVLLKCSKLIGFALATDCTLHVHDWLKRIVPRFHPIRKRFPALCVKFDWSVGLSVCFVIG